MTKLVPLAENPFDEGPRLTPLAENPFADEAPGFQRSQEQIAFEQSMVPRPDQPLTEIPIPKPLVERLTTGQRLKSLFNGFTEGVVEGFGHETIGIKPDELKRLRQWGIFRDPENPSAVDGLRLTVEPAATLFAAGVDTLLRVMRAGTFGVAGGLAEGVSNELGLDKTQEERLKRDAVIATDIIGLLTGANARPKMTRVRRGPMGETVDEVVSGVPKSKADFEDAAHAVAGTPDAHVEAKMQRLYEEKGVLPAEVYGDADRNPIVKQEILSSTDQLPTRYGDDGEPPIKNPPVKAADDAPEPPKKGTPEADLEDARAHVRGRLSVNEPDPSKPVTFGTLYRDWVDELFFIERAVQERGGKDMNAAFDPHKLMGLHAGWAGKSDVFIDQGTRGFHTATTNGKSLSQVFELINKSVEKLDHFREFIVAARAAEMEIRGFRQNFDMDKLMTIGRARTKAMVDAFEELVNYQNRLSAYARDAGLLSPEAYESMIANNRLFIPYYEVLAEFNGTGTGNANPFKKLTGGDRKIIDPLESVVKNTYALIEAADRNWAKLQLVDMLGENPKAPKGTALITKADDTMPAKFGDNSGAGAAEYIELRTGMKDVPEDLVKQMQEWATAPKEGEVVVYRNGRREVHIVDPEIANAINRADRETSNFLIKMLAAPVKPLRAGIVLAPEFGAKFLLRDSFYAAFTTVKGVLHPVDMIKAIGSMIMKDKDFYNWMYSGGADVTLISFDRNRIQASLHKLTEEAGLFTRSWNTVIDPNASYLMKGKAVLGLPIEAVNRGVIHPLQVFTDLALSTPHLAGFKKRMRQLEREDAAARRGRTDLIEIDVPEGAPKGELIVRDGVSLADAKAAYDNALTAPTEHKQRLLDAAWVSRNTSTDGKRMGAKMHSVNAISLFANSKVQDIDVLGRSLLTNPERAAKTSLILGAGIALPSAVLWALNKDDPRYKNLPQHEKDNNWIIITDRWEDVNPRFQEALMRARPATDFRIKDGKWQVNNGHMFRYPKPFTPGVIVGSGTERLLEKFFADNPKAFDGFLGAIYDSVAGDLTPNAVMAPMEQSANRKRFTGGTLIPAYLEKELPEYQFHANTTELSKAIGKTLAAVPGINQYRLPSTEGSFLGGMARAVTSPILIENYVRAITGPIGMYTLRVLDKGLRTAGVLPDPLKPDWNLADVPVVQAFVARYPQMNTDNIKEFFAYMKNNKAHFDTFMAKAQEGDVEAMRRVQEMGGPQMFVRLDGFQQAINAQAQMIRQINQAVKIYDEKKGIGISPSDARQHIDIIYFQMIQIGDAAKKTIDQIKAATSPK